MSDSQYFQPVDRIDNGGPAFPHPDYLHAGPWGMTLRDYFAAKAMAGMLARPGSINPRQDAEFAYMVADAMLKARAA